MEVHQQGERHGQTVLDKIETLIPIMPLWVAVLLALFNLVIPGSGTFLAALLVCLPCLYYNGNGFSRTCSFFSNVAIGVLQFLLAVVLIGYAWSVIWGFLFIVQAANHLHEYPTPTTGLHGALKKFIPEMGIFMGCTLLVVNMLAPGFGTMLSGLLTLCCCLSPDSVHVEARVFRIGIACISLMVGALQLLLVVVVVGWFWSIYWGTLFIILHIERSRRDNLNALALASVDSPTQKL